MKRILSVIAALILIMMPLMAQGGVETAQTQNKEMKSFTDDLGRTVEVPSVIDSVTPTGSTAQVILLTFDQSRITGLTTAMSDEEWKYYPGLNKDIPVLGTFYGKKADLNKEALIVVNPDVVIDIGEIKGSEAEMIADLDTLQEQIGLPVVFIESYLADSAHTYTEIGQLLDDEQRGKELADYASQAMEFANTIKEKMGGTVSFYYSSATDGLEAIPEGNFHGEVLEAVGGVNVVPSTFSSGGNAMSLEQIFLWDPDVIVLGNRNAYEEVLAPGSAWQSLSAVRNGRVYLVPDIINNWIDSPPSINRLIGIYWAAYIFYNDEAGVDIRKEAEEFYQLFYSYSISDEELSAFNL